MSSSNRVNYSIRLNKSIERKIMAEGINLIVSTLKFDYSYIGFGSLWFIDFIHFHKFLNIREMYSIESDKIIYKRAEYNNPYHCITVLNGESTEGLDTILDEEEHPCIIWLDYDANIFECSSFVSDVNSIVSKAKNGSILIATMNANNKIVRDLKTRAKGDEWKDITVDSLKNTFGNVQITTTVNKQFTNQEKFIQLVNPLFSQTIENSIYNSGNKKRHFKIFDFAYADNATMVTLGFILFDEAEASSINRLTPFSKPYFLNENTFNISAPVLTVREKNSIDKNLPSGDINRFIRENGTFESEAEVYLKPDKLGFPIHEQTFRSYSEIYKYYPTYFEIMHS